MKRTLLAVCFFSLASPAAASTYTVDDDGGHDYTTISSCANGVSAGDVCSVRDGQYSGWTQSNDGSPGSAITIVAAGGHSPTITSGITLTGADYLTIEGFEINGKVSSALSGSGPTNVKMIGNTFKDIDTINISLHGRHVLIDGNTFINVGNDCIRLFGDYHVVRNNQWIADDPPSTSQIHTDFLQSFVPLASQGFDESLHYTLVENNVMIDVSGTHTHFFLINDTDRTADPPHNIILRHNKVHFIGSSFATIDQNQQSGAYDNVVYNNTLSYLVEGTFTWHDAILEYSGSDNSSAMNNLTHTAMKTSNVRGYYWGAGGAQSHTLYYSDSGTMTFSGAAASETGARKNEDPLLVDPANNDFTLGTGSPAIDAGGHLTEVASADTGSGTSLSVDKAEFFQPGWAGTRADWIAVGTVNNVVQITSIDYGANMITLAHSISRSAGDAVWLYRDSDETLVLSGSLPDIGAVEMGGGTGPAVDGGTPSGDAGVLPDAATSDTSSNTADGSAGTDSASPRDGSAGTDSASRRDAAAPSVSEPAGCSCRTSVGPLGGQSLFAFFSFLGLLVLARRRRRMQR